MKVKDISPNSRWVKTFCLFLIASLIICKSLIAQDAVPVEAAPEAGTWNIPDWLYFILSFEFIWKGLLSVGGLFLAWTQGLEWLKKWREGDQKDAVEALEAGVVKTYEDFVKDLKGATGDKKLTKAERQEARNKAIAHAKEIATGPALKWLQVWGKERLEALVTKIVTNLKKKKQETKE